jgi:diamine N-acetyltransferase
MSLAIRPAGPDDLDALVALRPAVHDQHVAAHPEVFKAVTPAAARAEAAAWLAQDHAHVLLAEVDAEAVGYVYTYVASRPESGSVHARRALLVEQIAVRESARGRGTGAALLGAVRDLARRLDIHVIDLEVWHFNGKARRFFLAHGFTPLRERLTHILR